MAYGLKAAEVHKKELCSNKMLEIGMGLNHHQQKHIRCF